MKTLDAYPLDTKLVRKGAFTEALQDWDTYHQAFVELTLKHVGGEALDRLAVGVCFGGRGRGGVGEEGLLPGDFGRRSIMPRNWAECGCRGSDVLRWSQGRRRT